MSEGRILVVDDEEKMRHIINVYLTNENYIVDSAANGREALDKVELNEYDLIILDIMMPEVDGWTVCRKIREESSIPIILLTARGEEYEKIFGFDLGADDYLTKPFSLKELAVRVRAVLRRYLEPNGKQGKDIKIGALEIKTKYKQVLLDNKELVLTPKEYDLLYFLAKSPQIVYSREQLLRQVWGYDFLGDGRTVDTHIKQLREKLGGHKGYVQTVWGFGYKFKTGDKDEKYIK